MARKITYEIIGAEFDSGGRVRGTSLAPKALREYGLVQRLERLGLSVSSGHDVHVPPHIPSVRPGPPAVNDLALAEKFCAALFNTCTKTLERKHFPIILGGDHSVTIASFSALASHCRKVHGPEAQVGLLWIDAHPDLNTPESSPSGNLHGMVVRVLLGEGPDTLTALGGAGPKLKSEHLAQVGLRDIDPPEKTFLRSHPVTAITMKDIDMHGVYPCMQKALATVTTGTVGFMVSFDLDSCDPAIAPGVDTPVRGGFSFREAHLIMELVAERKELLAIELVEYDPKLDDKHASADLSIALIESALGKSIL